jgi:uncharacterized protein YehS (DUF1456 family)
MNSNDVMKRLRYALNITDLKVIEMFKLVDYEITHDELESIFKTEEEAGYVECGDELMGKFLDALVISRRGVRAEAGAGESPATGRRRIGNNDILKRLRIALELKDDDIIGIMRRAGVEISKSEVSALFRKSKHPNYRPCGDQFLRNFLVGLTAARRV